MKIMITHPYCWPYVRRGAERFIAELARYLTGRGHAIVTVSSKPGRTKIEHTDSGPRILHRQLWTSPMRKLRIEPVHTFVMGALKSALTTNVDVVQSLFFTDAWAANAARRLRGHRTVFQITGPPPPHAFPRVPPYRQMMRSAIRSANRRVVHSEFTRRVVQQYYDCDAAVIPVPIDIDAFPIGDGPPDRRPTILSVASFDERRKGLRVLIGAFEQVKRQAPDAVLRLSGHLSNAVRAEVIDPLPDAVKTNIEILGPETNVAESYRNASLTVLPSMWEAYGMVVVESWASGTPVVVTDHGGLAELVTDSTIGVKFNPQTDAIETTNVGGLAGAIVKGLALSQSADIRDRCRATAERFTWKRLGPEYEELYANSTPDP